MESRLVVACGPVLGWELGYKRVFWMLTTMFSVLLIEVVAQVCIYRNSLNCTPKMDVLHCA